MNPPSGQRSRQSAIGSRASSLIVDIEPLRLQAGFRSLWLSQFGSAIGRETIRLIVPVHLFLMTGSAAAIGAFAALQIVPSVAMALLGGAIADAFDRRVVLFWANTAMVATSGALMLLTAAGEGLVLGVVLVGVLHSGLTALEQPVRVSAVPRLVPDGQLAPAMSLVTLNFQTSSLVGPAVAGILLAVGGVPTALGFQAIGYVWAVALVVGIDKVASEERGRRVSVGSVTEGLRYVVGHRLILSTFAIDLVAMIFGLSLAVLPVIAIESLQLGPPGAAMLASAMAVGSLLAALTSGWTARVRHPGQAVMWAVLGYAVASALVGAFATQAVVVVIALAVCGAANVFSAIVRNTIVQESTPDRLRGRVTSAHVLVVTTGPRLGDVRNSTFAQGIGVEGALISGAVLAVFGVGLIRRWLPALAAYERKASSDL